jgi:hypothetical protein
MKRMPVLALSLLFLTFVSCATTQEVKKGETEQIVDTDLYSVKVPSDGALDSMMNMMLSPWEISLEKENRLVRFQRVLISPQTGSVLSITQIQVSPIFLKAECRDLTEDVVARNQVHDEETRMREKGTNGEKYELKYSKADVTTLGKKTLYRLRFTKRFQDSGNREEGVLYLYFPPDFRKKEIYYSFLMTLRTGHPLHSLYYGPFHDVVKSFRINDP